MTYEAKMDIERAREVVADVIDMRLRWGIQLSYSDFNKDDLLDALIVLQQDGIETANALVAKANRSAGAYKAQLAKAQQEKDALREEVADLRAELAEANVAIGELTDQLNKTEIVLNSLRKKAARDASTINEQEEDA